MDTIRNQIGNGLNQELVQVQIIGGANTLHYSIFCLFPKDAGPIVHILCGKHRAPKGCRESVQEGIGIRSQAIQL